MIARALVVGALLWPVLLGAALWDRVEHPAPGRSAWATAVYLAAAQVCHQHQDRSFHTHGEKWPVCARCAGLYLAAPFGVVGFLGRARLGRPGARRLQPPYVLIIAAVPTIATVLWEWGGLGMPAHWVRLVTALPLGAAIAAVLLAVTHRID
jgi:uncharacterized membrane protein